MYKLLGFPEVYRTGKKLDKASFLKEGNLTAGERRHLEVFLDHIEVLYSIPFSSESRVIVVFAKVEQPEQKAAYYGVNSAKAIAQSFDCPTMIILKCQGVFKFYVFDERKGIRDETRMVVTRSYSTPDIVGTERVFLETLVKKLRCAVTASTTSWGLINAWRIAIVEYAGGEREACTYALEDADMLRYSVDEYEESVRRSRIFEDCIEDEADDYDYDEEYEEDDIEWEYDEDDEVKEFIETARISDIYQGQALDEIGNREEAVFVEFCMRHCRSLHDEACEINRQEISDHEWLAEYLDACNQYAETFFGKAIDSNVAVKIVEAYEAHLRRYDDYDGSFDVNELKAFLNFYFD